MFEQLVERREEIERLCRRFGVSRLEVFGSATGDTFDTTRSDVDLLVEFRSEDTIDLVEAYFGLKESLEALFERPVDLVMASALRNPHIIHSIENSRQSLYAT